MQNGLPNDTPGSLPNTNKTNPWAFVKGNESTSCERRETCGVYQSSTDAPNHYLATLLQSSTETYLNEVLILLQPWKSTPEVPALVFEEQHVKSHRLNGQTEPSVHLLQRWKAEQ